MALSSRSPQSFTRALAPVPTQRRSPRDATQATVRDRSHVQRCSSAVLWIYVAVSTGWHGFGVCAALQSGPKHLFGTEPGRCYALAPSIRRASSVDSSRERAILPSSRMRAHVPGLCWASRRSVPPVPHGQVVGSTQQTSIHRVQAGHRRSLLVTACFAGCGPTQVHWLCAAACSQQRAKPASQPSPHASLERPRSDSCQCAKAMRLCR